MLKHTLQLSLVAFLFTHALWAVDDPFVGKWKLNPSKSRFPDEMKVQAAGENKYLFDFGGGSPETIVTDGTDQPGIFGTTLAVSVEGPDTWKVVRKKDGRTLLTAVWKLSKDGKTLSDTYRDAGTNGLSMDYVYERRTAGSGFAGTWDSVSEKMISAYELEIKPYEDNGLSFTTSIDGVTRSLRFDGKDYPRVGPGASPDAVSSGRRVNERTVEIMNKNKGRVSSTWQVELSPDRKSLTMTLHVADQRSTNVMVFERE